MSFFYQICSKIAVGNYNQTLVHRLTIMPEHVAGWLNNAETCSRMAQ